MITQEYVHAYAAVSDGELDTLILPQVNTHCMQLFMDEVASRHPNDRIILALDWVGWHCSHILKLPHNLRLLMLPPYSSELNPLEDLWDELREKSFHNRVFDSLDALENHPEEAMSDMKKERVTTNGCNREKGPGWRWHGNLHGWY
jgi:hypothetical protein